MARHSVPQSSQMRANNLFSLLHSCSSVPTALRSLIPQFPTGNNRRFLCFYKPQFISFLDGNDLFRLDLLEQFRLKLPKDSDEEYQVWENLGQLIALGPEAIAFDGLEYKSKEPKK